jgi:hypothetical protein
MSLKPLRRACARLALMTALLAGGASAVTVASVQPAAAAEAGVNLNNLSPSSAALATTLGAHWIRVFAQWRELEPSRGTHDASWLEQYDRTFASLPKGTKVILDLVGAPAWETGSTATNAPPQDPADYATLLHFIATRWAGRVAAFEIWNEEDASRWWAGAPDPGAYTRLLQSAYTAVKSADPSTEVVLGGLTGNDYDFLQNVYEAGGKGSFDAIGVHTDTACNISSPYEFMRENNMRMFQDAFLAYREVHATELANNDDKPIWMTEMSWRTSSGECTEGTWAGQKAAGVSEAEQARNLSQAYHCLAGDPYVQLALWFPIVDEGVVTSGLIRPNMTHKPSYAAMRSYIQNGDQLTEPCGDFSGPKITLYHPTNGQRYTGRLSIKVKASDVQGIRRIRLLDDGHLIRNFDPHIETQTYPQVDTAEMRWFGAMKLPLGRHVLTIVALDKMQNASSVQLTIVHMREHRHRYRHHH